MPTRGGAPDNGGPPPDTGGGMGDLAAMMQGQEDQQQQQDAQEVLQKMRQDVGKTMRQFQTYASQFPAASKEADMVQKAMDGFLRAIVKNAPGSNRNQSSPMVPA